MSDLDILKKVSLLAIFKKEDNETIDDIIDSLIDVNMFINRDEALSVFKELRDNRYIIGDSLSMIGIVEAKKAEEEFKQ